MFVIVVESKERHLNGNTEKNPASTISTTQSSEPLPVVLLWPAPPSCAHLRLMSERAFCVCVCVYVFVWCPPAHVVKFGFLPSSTTVWEQGAAFGSPPSSPQVLLSCPQISFVCVCVSVWACVLIWPYKSGPSHYLSLSLSVSHLSPALDISMVTRTSGGMGKRSWHVSREQEDGTVWEQRSAKWCFV